MSGNQILRFILLVLLALNTPGIKAQNKKPNIIFILADDLGYGDVGVYNPQSRIQTPNIDKLAKQGMMFTDAHAPSSVCTPSRYSILTGRYAWRTKLKKQVFYSYEPSLIEPTRKTVATVLKSSGYRTAAIGKWHVGLDWAAKKGQTFNFNRPLPWPGGALPVAEESRIDFAAPIMGGPVDLGFDYFYGTNACATCNTPYCYIENRNIVQQPTEYYKGKYLEQRNGFRSPDFDEITVDSLFTVRAVDFIEKSAKEKSPFFLYLSASAPHEPCEEAVVPQFLRGVSKAGPRGDLVAYFDWMVGKVMASLEKTGQAKNTIIIVTSDNGAKPGNYGRATYGHQANGDLRGFKGSVWDGGHRVPMIVKWPQVIRKGSVNNQFIGLQDLIATVAELTNTKLDDSTGEDSISFLAALSNNSGNVQGGRKDLVHHSTNGVFAIRSGDWKLIVDCDNSGDGGRGVDGNTGTGPDPAMKGQLYNLADDPYELFNMIERNKPKEQELRKLLQRYQDEGRSVKH